MTLGTPNRQLTVYTPNGTSSGSLNGYIYTHPLCLTFFRKEKVICGVDRQGTKRTCDCHTGTLFQNLLSLPAFNVLVFLFNIDDLKKFHV